MSLRHLALAAICAAAFSPAFADTTVTLLHVSEDKNAQALWGQIAKDYEAAHPGVKVEVKYLENEAFKAKLPTMLQADESRPSLFYSWGGGVMDAQAKAGFLKDVSADVAGVEANMASTAVDAIKVDGKAVGVPFDQGVVSFFYNKKLFEKAGVKAEEIKSWDDSARRSEETQGGRHHADLRWGRREMADGHFYYSYLVMRIGGEHALADAKAGKDGGFKSATFVEAGKRLRELAALEPFQPGYLTTKHAESTGIFGDGKAAMELMGEWFIGMQAPFSTSGKGQPEEDIGIFSFPIVTGGKGKATDTLGGVNAFLVTKTAPKEAVDFLNFFSQEKYAKEAAEKGAYIPAYKGAEAWVKDPLVKQVAAELAATTYHQNFFDQDLGPSVGRVINDVSVAVAAGQMTPEAAAANIQDAWDQQ